MHKRALAAVGVFSVVATLLFALPAEAQVSDCSSLRQAISQLDREISDPSNPDEQRQSFLAARNNYSKMYNEVCTGGGSSGGGSYSAPAPDPAAAWLNFGVGVLGWLAQREQARSAQQAAQAHQAEIQREMREAEEAEARAEAARQAKIADDNRRAATCNSFNNECQNDPNNPFKPVQMASLPTFNCEQNPFQKGCQFAGMRETTPGVGGGQFHFSPAATKEIQNKLKAAGYPACPTEEQAHQYCGVPTPTGSSVANSCVDTVVLATLPTRECKVAALRRDLELKKAVVRSSADVDKAILEHRCKVRHDESACAELK